MRQTSLIPPTGDVAYVFKKERYLFRGVFKMRSLSAKDGHFHGRDKSKNVKSPSGELPHLDARVSLKCHHYCCLWSDK